MPLADWVLALPRAAAHVGMRWAWWRRTWAWRARAAWRRALDALPAGAARWLGWAAWLVARARPPRLAKLPRRLGVVGAAAPDEVARAAAVASQLGCDAFVVFVGADPALARVAREGLERAPGFLRAARAVLAPDLPPGASPEPAKPATSMSVHASADGRGRDEVVDLVKHAASPGQLTAESMARSAPAVDALLCVGPAPGPTPPATLRSCQIYTMDSLSFAEILTALESFAGSEQRYGT